MYLEDIVIFIYNLSQIVLNFKTFNHFLRIDCYKLLLLDIYYSQ